MIRTNTKKQIMETRFVFSFLVVTIFSALTSERTSVSPFPVFVHTDADGNGNLMWDVLSSRYKSERVRICLQYNFTTAYTMSTYIVNHKRFYFKSVHYIF